MKGKKGGTEGPDQGYAWIIALACFGINFIMVGIARSIGVMYAGIVHSFGVPRKDAMFPFSIRVSVRNLLGPVIGLLGQKYGIRRITAFGGLVAGLGSILCYFAPNILWITVFWGVIHGMGFGLSTVLHMMVIGQYFNKYKASALGLGYSGDCFGTFAFPVIIENLLATYDIKGTFLILGGIVLNVVPLGLLLKKPPWLKSERKFRNLPKTIDSISGTNLKKYNSDNSQFAGYGNKAFVNSEADLALEENDDMSKNTVNFVHGQLERLPTYREATLTGNDVINRKCSPLPSLNGSLRSHKPQNEYLDHLRDNMEQHDSLPPVSENEDVVPVNRDQETSSGQINEGCLQSDGEGIRFEGRSSIKKRTSSFVEVAQELVNRMRTASFASQVAQDAFVCNINQESANEPDSEAEAEKENEVASKTEFGENASVERENNTSQTIAMPSGRVDSMKVKIERKDSAVKPVNQPTIWMTLFRTNTKPMFILISLTMAIYAYLFVGVLTIIIDYAVDLGISQDHAKFLIIGFSVADLVGRLSFGQVIDRKLMKMKNYTAMNMILMGVLVAVIPLNSNFKYIMVCMCLYGLFQGGTAIMFPILVSDYMDKNEESVAMGCLNFYGGLLMLLMAPMIGYFRDNTGTYNSVFHIIGGSASFVGLLWQLEPLILRHQTKRLKEKRLKMDKNIIICTKL